VGRLLALSCALSGAGLIGYTLVPQWWMMVALGVVAGLGAGAIDAGLNTYVAAHFGETIMQWLHACWGVGVTLGPLIMTLGLTRAGTWRVGYYVVAAFELLLALAFGLTARRWRDGSPANHDAPERLTDYRTPMRDSLRVPQVWLSFMMYFLYVGAESGAGVWAYTLLVESRGVDPALAGFWTGSYWATFTIGRMLAGALASRIRGDALVTVSIAGAVLGALLLIWNPSQMANVAAVALIGFSIAPIFPALMSGTVRRVGAAHAANTIGLQMTATGFGMMVVPSLMGVLASRLSLEAIPVCLLAVYLGLAAIYAVAVFSARSVARVREGVRS
jgi:fucose permease